MEVLLQIEEEGSGRSQRSVVRVTTRPGDTVAELKRGLSRLEGFPPAVTDLSVLFNGQRLDDSDALDACGVDGASRGGEQWASSYVYPNGWTLLGHRKAFPKVGSGYTWVALRSAALERGAGGTALALLLLICLCNTLLPAVPT